MQHGTFERWSDAIFNGACYKAKGIDPGMVWTHWRWRAVREAMEDPKNWKRVRIPRDAKTRRQAARVTRALRRHYRRGNGDA